MADGSRIPRTIPAFNNYITVGYNRLVAVNPATTKHWWEDYGLTNAQFTDWENRYKDWTDTVYPAYINPATSTTVAKADVHTFMEDFRTFANPILDIIEVSPLAGNEEEHIFHFVLHRHGPTHPTTNIKEECVAAIEAMGRGMYEISCKKPSDDGRAAVVPGANGVQMGYVISSTPLAVVPPQNDPSVIKEISNRAHFNKDFGAENQSKWLYIAFRWYNTHYPQFAGPWGEYQAVAIG